MNGQPFSTGCTARYRQGLVCALFGLCLGTAAWADEPTAEPFAGAPKTAEPPLAAEPAPGPQPPRRIDPLVTLQALSRYLTPYDMAELSRFMFEVVMDFFKGTQEASLPPDLAFKLAVLEQRFKREGDVYMQQVLRDLDRDIRRFLSENLPFLPPLPAMPELRARNGD
ncbi:MAG: hypothetical protein ACK4TK_02285 [Thiobacillaceae bacterium]